MRSKISFRSSVLVNLKRTFRQNDPFRKISGWYNSILFAVATTKTGDVFSETML